MFHIQYFNRTIHPPTLDNIEELISREFNLHTHDYYLVVNNRKVHSEFDASGNTVHVVPRLLGGKGGFGSMLRAIGAQIEKTTNREACRDLSGRRLRDINEEKRLKTWLSQKEQREREAEERRRRKLEKLCQEPKVEIKDQAFLKERSELTENISNAVELGLQASTTAKRKLNEPAPVVKKKPKKLYGESSNEESSDEDSE